MPAPLPPAEDKPGVPVAPPVLFLAPLVLLLALEMIASTSLGLGPWRLPAGASLVALGAGIAVWGAVAQRRAGTDFLPDRPSTAIVARGPYRFTRNPMYFGFALITAGLALVADSWWALAAVPLGAILMDRIIIAREERYLERKFGAEYLSYKRRVRRWL